MEIAKNSSYSTENLSGDEDDPEIQQIVFALSDFKALGKDQLAFTKGQQINIVHKWGDDWWWAELEGCYGYVPVNHLTSNQQDTFVWQDEEYFSNYGNLKLHHEMLSDKARTSAYMNAIVNNVKQLEGKVVLDVGCGTGILSMLCAKHGLVKKVYAVEASDMAQHTKEVIEHNNLSHIIHVMHGNGEEVVIEEQVDLIISEWMGTALLFEMMIESVIIMRDKYLKDSGKIWPSSASLYLVPCSAHAQYTSKIDFWDNQFGFDFTPLKPVAKDDLLSKPDHMYVLPKSDCLSEECLVLDLDMKTVSVQDLEELESTFDFTITKDDIMHGFCTWFEVGFSPFEKDVEKVVLNTGPDHPLTHWKHNLFLLDNPITVERDDRVKGTFKISRNPRWRRHVRIWMKFQLLSGKQSNTATASVEKQFFIWR